MLVAGSNVHGQLGLQPNQSQALSQLNSLPTNQSTIVFATVSSSHTLVGFGMRGHCFFDVSADGSVWFSGNSSSGEGGIGIVSSLFQRTLLNTSIVSCFAGPSISGCITSEKDSHLNLRSRWRRSYGVRSQFIQSNWSRYC